ncbi:hypothetical protein L226DRAFT_234757 [Lentinus tigrinus ALCF2SS1-7]|uniref:uncharacterized protein n=1 Tax=Lentinus tigrinus ALCF2SS1-7 TaxID=1328758 RepID=UPI001165CDC9|nr:hypothetical protein L226DRAFT_234757 [Lentinus tigrinus ALCF2SS1-7]
MILSGGRSTFAEKGCGERRLLLNLNVTQSRSRTAFSESLAETLRTTVSHRQSSTLRCSQTVQYAISTPFCQSEALLAMVTTAAGLLEGARVQCSSSSVESVCLACHLCLVRHGCISPTFVAVAPLTSEAECFALRELYLRLVTSHQSALALIHQPLLLSQAGQRVAWSRMDIQNPV